MMKISKKNLKKLIETELSKKLHLHEIAVFAPIFKASAALGGAIGILLGLDERKRLADLTESEVFNKGMDPNYWRSVSDSFKSFNRLIKDNFKYATQNMDPKEWMIKVDSEQFLQDDDIASILSSAKGLIDDDEAAVSKAIGMLRSALHLSKVSDVFEGNLKSHLVSFLDRKEVSTLIMPTLKQLPLVILKAGGKKYSIYEEKDFEKIYDDIIVKLKKIESRSKINNKRVSKWSGEPLDENRSSKKKSKKKTIKDLHLDKPTSHGGWPDGHPGGYMDPDTPVYKQISDYLESMGLIDDSNPRARLSESKIREIIRKFLLQNDN